jgi:beta-mannanase
MIVDYCRTKLSPLASDKVQYVWHSWAASLSDGLIIEDFYPGDDFVDWIGVSIFQQLYPWSNEGNKDTGSYASWSLEHVENVLKFAINHDKVRKMIYEYCVF